MATQALAPQALLPTLELSGAALRCGLEALVKAAEPGGGIDAYMMALQFKARLFAEWFNGKQSAALDLQRFLGLCTFMPTVRRRIGAWLADHDFADLQRQLSLLTRPDSAVQARIDAFTTAFPGDRGMRWVRDLAAEVLHFSAPDEVPLMTRWMWDARTGSGVLREIWYEEGSELNPAAIGDGLGTFLALQNELSGFLRDNGFYRDFALMQDLLCAHVYACYINDRGSTFLKGDFAGGEDAMAHTRRLLGLDCYERDGIRMKVKLPESMAAQPAAPLRLNA